MSWLLRKLGRALGSPAIIVVAAFVLRFGLLLYYHSLAPSPRMEHMKYGYETGSVAASIASGHGFSSPFGEPTGPTAWFTPVYPYLLAGVFKVFGIYTYRSLLVILTLNCAFTAFASLAAYLIGLEAFGVRVGIAAAWLWVFQPTAILFPLEWVWDTSLTALMMALIVWATLRLRDTMYLKVWLAYGALCALAILTNPSVLSVLPFLLLWLVFSGTGRVRKRIRLAASAVLVMVVGITPWIVRNSLVFGTFVGLRSNFGLELYLGNNEKVTDAWAWEVHPNDSKVERIKYRQMGEIAYMKEKQRDAIRFMLTHPADVVHWSFKRFIHTWTGTTDPLVDTWTPTSGFVRVLLLYNFLFPVLTFLGLFFASRARNTATLPLFIVIFCFPLVYYFSHASLRYRHPIDPIMSVLTAYAVVHLIAHAARRFQTQRTPLTEQPSASGFSQAQ